MKTSPLKNILAAFLVVFALNSTLFAGGGNDLATSIRFHAAEEYRHSDDLKWQITLLDNSTLQVDVEAVIPNPTEGRIVLTGLAPKSYTVLVQAFDDADTVVFEATAPANLVNGDGSLHLVLEFIPDTTRAVKISADAIPESMRGQSSVRGSFRTKSGQQKTAEGTVDDEGNLVFEGLQVLRGDQISEILLETPDGSMSARLRGSIGVNGETGVITVDDEDFSHEADAGITAEFGHLKWLADGFIDQLSDQGLQQYAKIPLRSDQEYLFSAYEGSEGLEFVVRNSAEDWELFGYGLMTFRPPTTGAYSILVRGEPDAIFDVRLAPEGYGIGKIQVTRDPSSLGDRVVPPGRFDVVTLTARVRVDEPILVDGLIFRFDEWIMAHPDQYTSNWRVFLNDRLIDHLHFDENGNLRSDTTFEISGTSIIKVATNIGLNTVSGASFRLAMGSWDFIRPTYLSTNTLVPATLLFGEAVGSDVETQYSEVTLSETSGISDGTPIVAGVDDITGMEFVIDNNPLGDVLVTGALIELVTSGQTRPQDVTVAIFAQGVQQGSAQILQNGLGYFPLWIPIASAHQLELTVVVDTYEGNAPGEMQFRLLDLEVDNVETAQPAIIHGLPVDGPVLRLIESGSLHVSLGSTEYSDILVAGEEDQAVFTIRFTATDDEVQIKDLYLRNLLDLLVESRLDFKVYDANGHLIQAKQMINGELQFELGNTERIRVPKNGSTFVTIKVDVRDVSKANQTGHRLQLALDTAHVTGGIEAVTAATGNDLSVPVDGWGSAVGEPFVVTRTRLSVTHATQQPFVRGPQVAQQELYRFTVTADEARGVDLGRVTLGLQFGGMKTTGSTFAVYQVNSFTGQVDTAANVIKSIATGIPSTGGNNGIVAIDFSNQRLAPGESRTYSLLVDQMGPGSLGDPSDGEVAVSLLGDNQYRSPDDRVAFDYIGNNFLIWSDEADPSHSDTTKDWHNGYLVQTTTYSQVNETH